MRKTGKDPPWLSQTFLFCFEKPKPGSNRFARMEPVNPGSDGTGHSSRGQLTQIRQQVVAVLIELSKYPGPLRYRPVVELTGQLVLDDAAFFFDDQDLFQAPGKLVGGYRLQRQLIPSLKNEADASRLAFVDTEVFEGLHDIQIRFAGSDDPRRGLSLSSTTRFSRLA